MTNDNNILGIYKYIYNKEFDILDIFFKKVAPSYSQEIAPGIYGYFTRDTDELIGYSIMDYSSRDKNQLNTQLPVQINFDDVDKKLNTLQEECQNFYSDVVGDSIKNLEEITFLYEMLSNKFNALSDKLDRKTELLYNTLDRKVELLYKRLEGIEISLASTTSSLKFISDTLSKLTLRFTHEKPETQTSHSNTSSYESPLKYFFFLYAGVFSILLVLFIYAVFKF